MAMSDTGSSFAQWAGIYHHDHDPLPALPTDDDLVSAAAAASPTSGGSSGSPTTTKAAGQQKLLHGVEGPRAGKPARRRSRASRRAPVTMLNTDAANFRAMVQQFTGIPAPPAGAFGVGGPVISFAADYGFPPHSSSASAVMSFDHHHQQQLHHAPLQDQQQQLLRRQQQYTGASSALPFGYGSGGGGLLHGGGDVFGSHGLASAEDRLLLQSIQAAAHQMPHMTPASTATNTTTSGFFA